MAIARDFSPRIERHGASCVVLDVSGLGRLIGDAQAIGAELEREALARGGSIRIAVGPTQSSVRLLTLAHPGLTIADGDPAGAVAALPIGILRQWLDDDAEGRTTARAKAAVAADHKRLDTFQRWGLARLGEIAALPAADLSERMGQEGLALQRLARGLDSVPLVPDPGIPRFVESLELEWPIDALEPLSFVLARLLEPLSASLERADRGAAAVRLDLRLVDRTTHQRVLLLPAAMRDARVLRTLLLLDLESHPPSAAIDVVTVEVDPAPSRIVQYSLLERATPSPETLATLTARLGALVGERRCGTPSLLDTHRPDGFEMTRFAPFDSATAQTRSGQAPSATAQTRSGQAPSATAQTRSGQAPSATAQTRSGQAPSATAQTRSGQAPSATGQARSGQAPSATGQARSGQGSSAARARSAPGSLESPPALRRFRPPIAIRVKVEEGRPVHVEIDRRGMPGGRVVQHAGPWRTSGAWWGPGAAWDRDEWDVTVTDNVTCRLFRDRITGHWFMDGVVD